MEGDRPILLTGDAVGTHVGFNAPATKETVNAELHSKVNQYSSASTSTSSTTSTVKPTTTKSALSGLVKASQNKEASTTTAAPTNTSSSTAQSTMSSALDDLEKLADLKAKGILTEEEFQMKKKQILGL